MSTSNIDPEKIILEVALSRGYLSNDLVFEKIFSKDIFGIILDLAHSLLDQSRVEVIDGNELILFYQDTSIDQLTADNKVENIELNLYITKKLFLELMAEWFWTKEEEEDIVYLKKKRVNIFNASKHEYIMQYIYCSHQHL